MRKSAVPPAVAECLPSAISYEVYEDLLRSYAELRPEDASTEEDRVHRAFGPINLQRALRIRKSYTPSTALETLLGSLTSKQDWLVLSEVWCGDSAQTLPYLSRLAELSRHIRLHILLRDQHPDIMDLYTTDGKRCIPKLVVFSSDGFELLRWGPRPSGAQAAVDAALAEGLPKLKRLERLHLWYGRDRGQTMESELHALFLHALGQGD